MFLDIFNLNLLIKNDLYLNVIELPLINSLSYLKDD